MKKAVKFWHTVHGHSQIFLSWLNGYQKRYGFVYVDREEEEGGTLNRYKKKIAFTGIRVLSNLMGRICINRYK